MTDYYSKVVSDLTNYKEYKQRIQIIKKKLDYKLESGMGIDYSQPSVQTSNNYDSTEETALDRLDNELSQEYRKKKKLVLRIDIAFQGLDPVEKFIIRKKYMTGRIEKDVNIYTHPEFEWGKVKYYEFKDRAVKKLARIMGYCKNEQLLNNY